MPSRKQKTAKAPFPIQRPDIPLFENQAETLAFALDLPYYMDASDPGTGKTRTQLELFAHRRRNGAGAMLVLAPKTILESAWADDAALYVPDMKVSVAYSTNRRKAFATDADIYITNFDAVRWLGEQKPGFFRKFDTLVLDEVTKFKHNTSQRSKAASRIRKYFNYTNALSGSLNTRTITDLWHPYFLLDRGQRLGSSFFRFRRQVCTPIDNGFGLDWFDKPEAEQAVSSLVSDITVRYELEQCVSLPKNHRTVKKFHMSPKQAKSYKQMEALAVAQLESGEVITTAQRSAVSQKLLQIASGAVYDSERGYHLVDTSRYEFISELVQQTDHSVVFYNWHHQRDLLEKQFKKDGVSFITLRNSNRAQAVRAFQHEGQYQVLLAHPESAAHGVTATRANQCIWASPPRDLDHFVQGNRRIFRAGQRRRTHTLVVLAESSYDEYVYEVLTSRDKRYRSTMDALQSLYKDRAT